MSLIDLLPLCPLCGHDPLQGSGARAHCSGCNASFDVASRARIRVRDREGDRLVEAADLLDRLDERGLDVQESGVTLARAEGEAPVHFGGQVLGFREILPEAVEGTLRLDGEELFFEPAAEGAVEVFRLEALRALQGASSSLQLSFVDGTVLLLRFADASPRRWEVALQEAVRALWQSKGRGLIEEFQPWIRIPDRRAE